MQTTIEKAIAAQREGKLNEAENLYLSILKTQPTNLEANNNLGNILQSYNKFSEATEYYKKALKIRPNYAEIHNNLGTALFKLHKLDDAVKSFNKAVELKPNFTEAYSNLGNTLYQLGRLDEAETSLQKAIKLNPNNYEVYQNLGSALSKLGRLEESKKSYRKSIELKPNNEVAKHLLSAQNGETPTSTPEKFVEKLFDYYALSFDNHLVKKLEYKIPKIIAEIILRLNLNKPLGSVLDLGCGTGLMGVEIKKYCNYLEGVDLSNLMLEQARTKNIYNKLTYSNIFDYLSKEKLNFDYFIAADVFVYVGDLSEVLRLIKTHNKSNSKLIFSTEHTNEDRFVLKKSGRYAHSKKYIENLCEKFNYKIKLFEKTNLRKDADNETIIGGLYLLDF